MRVVLLWGLFISLSGCQMLSGTTPAAGREKVCQQQVLIFSDEPCARLSWLYFLQSHMTSPWPERRQQLSKLGNHKEDRLKKVLLSQGIDTPYESRLRAQYWLQDLHADLPTGLAETLEQLVLKPGNKMLELESALVTMGKINAGQSNTIEEQKQTIQLQQQKLNALLSIEADLSQGLDAQRENTNERN